MSEKFLNKFFTQLSVDDFKKDKFLLGFYKFYRKEKKEKGSNLFECYTEYITRNKDFDENKRDSCIRDIYDDIKHNMLKPNEIVDPNKIKADPFTEEPIAKPAITGKVKLKKSKAMAVLSDFIKESFIITNENPDQEYTVLDQEYMENSTTNIVSEILEDGRTLPNPKKDVVFGKRDIMMNIWCDTKKKWEAFQDNKELLELFNKIFFIDTSVFVTESKVPIKQPHINTIELLTERKKEVILPLEKFVACYSNKNYNTITTLTNNYPLEDLTYQFMLKNKTIYICSGSQNICGGNADQGIDILESMLYMTTTYSITIERANKAFPLTRSQVVVCPNVLIIKDTSYNMLPVNKWKKVSIMNAPCKYKPKTNLVDQDSNGLDMRLYDSKTELMYADAERIRSCLMGAIETALFLGYDTIILDDRGVEDNWLPAHAIAKIIKSVIGAFRGRLKEVVISVNKANSFNVFKYYF
jgi:hypothetical protein